MSSPPSPPAAPAASWWPLQEQLVPAPLSALLVLGALFLLYRLWARWRHSSSSATPSAGSSWSRSAASCDPPAAQLPPLPAQDFTLQQLSLYDGRQEGGRILVAVNHRVYDVTRGAKFYGPGGAYAAFAGRDASRGLATFTVEGVTDKYDDLSDLSAMQMESVREWDAQFKDRYVYVGKLLRPGEVPSDYTEESELESDTDKKTQ